MSHLVCLFHSMKFFKLFQFSIVHEHGNHGITINHGRYQSAMVLPSDIILFCKELNLSKKKNQKWITFLPV